MASTKHQPSDSEKCSELNSQEELMMASIKQQNRLMRRKLNSIKRPVRNETPELLQMRKKMEEMEKLQDMYKKRIDELEGQVSNFHTYSGRSSPIGARFSASPKRKLMVTRSLRTKNTTDASTSSSGSSSSSLRSAESDITIPVEPAMSVNSRSQLNEDAYVRVSSKPHPDRTKLLALYDYMPQAETKGRLAFKEGDILLLVNMKSRTGWWQAELNGEIGKIPSNYVEQLDPSRAFKARVIKNYEAQQPGDMSLQRGTLVTILKRQENGWYLGEKGSITGFFPSAHVERVVVPLP